MLFFVNKCSFYFRYYISICFIILIFLVQNYKAYGTEVSKVNDNDESTEGPSDSLRTDCLFPTFSVQAIDVTSENGNDGKLIISNIYDATHVEIILGKVTPFDFNLANPVDVTQKTMYINNIENPTGLKFYRIRMYNQNKNCYTDQVARFEHVNFAKDREFSAVELIQGVDNQVPQINDIVTFTAVVSSKGNKISAGVEVKQFLSSTLEIINFYTDRGTYTPTGGIWNVGDMYGGQTGKLVIRAKVKAQGLSYATTYISRTNGVNNVLGQLQASDDGTLKSFATNCVSVPISIKSGEIYNVVIKKYKGIKWYYKDPTGNFIEITKETNPSIASINTDSSLTVKQGGEYTFTKKVGECNVSSCCPILVETCAGPAMTIDSLYCSKTIDSYNIIVSLKNDTWGVVEKVYFAMANMGFPVLSSYLSRLNALPISSSSGFITSLGSGRYKIENIPAFMPNVTLVSTDLTGACRTVKVVNAPNCATRGVGTPKLANATQFFTEDGKMPSFVVEANSKSEETVWYADELGTVELHVGRKFKPKKEGTYYVANRDKVTGSQSLFVEAIMKSLNYELPGKFNGDKVCNCENSSIIPQGDLGELSLAKAYPNPVSDRLSIDYKIPSSSQNAEIVFYNINGRKMISLPLNKNQLTVKVDTQKWIDGTYFYHLTVDGQKVASQKVIVIHN
jgi:hypothetical protein